jgi:hypothetical protein
MLNEETLSLLRGIFWNAVKVKNSLDESDGRIDQWMEEIIDLAERAEGEIVRRAYEGGLFQWK